MNRLQGKIALITGGTTGIGLASAKRFLAEGARIAITGQDQGRLDAARDELGGDVLALRANAGKLDEIEHITAELKSAFGKIDIAFLNAGTGRFQSLPDVSEDLLDEMFNVNVKGVLFAAKSLAPIINDGGSVIITTSINNRMGMAASAAYAASKGASAAIMRVLAGELADRNIRVNAIAPGPVQTTMGPKLGIPEELRPAFTRAIMESIPLKRVGQADELASVAAFLASNDASYVNAIELVVDGGWTGVMR
jgi:NAD(P)-dependent dehydrogenase (short-subunit alcohol dehydrogenase family)